MKKIPTVFKRIFDEHKIIDILPEITEGCETAFLCGDATVKFDGSPIAIINGRIYKRFDLKPGRTLPDGAIPCAAAPDTITGHFPHWVPCNRDNPADTWFFEAYNEYHTRRFAPPATYEAIGKHFNGNPYCLEKDTLEKHGEKLLDVKRDFESVREFLWEHYIEGIVFWFGGDPVCKIKRSDFGFGWGAKK